MEPVHLQDALASPVLPQNGSGFCAPSISLQDRLQAYCRTGRGATIHELGTDCMTSLLMRHGIRSQFPELSPEKVFLTPHTTHHPILGQGPQRTLSDRRTFSFQLDPTDPTSPTTATLLIKGGDCFFTSGVREGIDRIRNGQIPGMGLLGANQFEFSVAEYLHEQSLLFTGSLAGVPVPHSVRRIDYVPTECGELVPIKDFLNSPEYVSLSELDRAALELPQGVPLGDLLLDDIGRTPSEYLAIIDGPNIRCQELLGILTFAEAEELPRRDLFGKPPFGLYMGHALLAQIPSYDTIIRKTYTTLGQVWGVDVSPFLPEDEITPDSYAGEIQAIRQRLTHEGIGNHILRPFTVRILDTLALAHALGFTFSSRHSSLAGSAHPRNVTISGTLCDLDSLHEAEWNLNFVRKDFGEAMASVATLARALFPEVGPSWNPLDPSSGNDFLTSALEYYREGLEQYSCSTVISDTLMLGVSTPHLRERIERFLLGANA